MKRTVIFVLAFVVAAAVCFAEETAEGNSPNASADLGAVVVTAGIYPSAIGLVSGSFEVIGAEDMELYGLDTIADVLDTVGCAYVKKNGGGQGLSNLVMRGASSRRNLVMIDGVPVGEDPVWGGIDLSLFDLSGVEKVEIIKGDVSSLLGGNATGGAVNIINGKGDGKFFTQDASYGTFDTRKFTAGLNFSVLGADIRLSGIDESSAGYTANSDYERDTVKGSVDYASGVYKSKISAFYVKREMGLPGSISMPSLTDRQYDEAFNASIDNRINLDFMDVKVFGSMNKGELTSYGTTRKSEYTADISFSTGKGSPFSLAAGYETALKLIDSAYLARREIRENAVASALGADLFDEALAMNASFRLDNSTAYGNAVSGGFNAEYAVMKELSAHAGINTGFSEPTIWDLYFPENSTYKPNPGLVPENSVTYEGGVDYSAGSIKAGVTAYYRDITNLIAPAVDGGKYTKKNISSAYVAGVEASAEYSFGKDAGVEASYAFLYGIDRALKEKLTDMPAHKVTGRGFVKLFGKVRLSVSCGYTGDRIDGYYLNTVAGYFLMDAKAIYEVNENFSVSLDIDNIYDNKDYQVIKDYAMPGRAVAAGIKAGF